MDILFTQSVIYVIVYVGITHNIYKLKKSFNGRIRTVNMPIYEYECNKCKTIYEHMVLKNSDLEKQKIICPDCEEECVKIMSQSYFHASMDSPRGVAPPDFKNGLTTKIPIIKDRKTGRTLSGPILPEKN